MKSIPRPKKDKPASEPAPSKFNRVVEIGRERKYVPAGEREQFGADPTSSEEISSVISLLGDGDGDGEIAVEASEDSPFAEAEEEKDEEWVPEVPEEKEEREDRSSLLRDSSDPVRMYLQEMGGVALLSREDEVVIAKSIEAGELEVRKAVFSLPLALQYVLNLADRLRDGEIDGRHLFGDDEEEASNGEGQTEQREDARVGAFLKHISRLRRLVNEREKLVAEKAKKKTSAKAAARIDQRLENIKPSIHGVLSEVPLGARQVTVIVDKLKEAITTLDAQRTTIRRNEPEPPPKKEPPKGKAAAKPPRFAPPKKSAEQLAQMAADAREARKRIKTVERETQMSEQELRDSFAAIRRGE